MRQEQKYFFLLLEHTIELSHTQSKKNIYKVLREYLFWKPKKIFLNTFWTVAFQWRDEILWNNSGDFDLRISGSIREQHWRFSRDAVGRKTARSKRYEWKNYNWKNKKFTTKKSTKIVAWSKFYVALRPKW